ncbi:hypothetical protein [Curtobacterium sp. P97]|jgi:hypothetical protein|uniref:hypothetical protein n=1 Tax=Curtobacterium sp. P97 TaxID=2939562 RepID=UPI00203FC56E|nr:hypothetical protein [Curtobacterium sp. P97]MCM3520335.1 hypothetical protein [Curtobacterium sp. P97]
MVAAVEPWTWATTYKLVLTSYIWLAGAVAPTGAVITCIVIAIRGGVSLDGAASALLFVVVFVVVFAVIAAVGAAVALPFTQLLGRALRCTLSRAVHVSAHAVLGGTLAAIGMQVLLLAFEDDHLTWQYPLAVSVPAGIAAAIGRRRLDEAERRRSLLSE